MNIRKGLIQLTKHTRVLAALLGSLVTLTARLALFFQPINSLLPLPRELEVKGWIFAILSTAGVVAIVTYSSFPARRFESRPNLVFILIVCGFGGFVGGPVAFWAVEYWWKHSSNVFLADLIYQWVEPLVHGVTFGLIAGFVTVLGHYACRAWRLNA